METQIHVPVGSPAIVKIPIFVNEQSVTEGAMKLIKELRPAWDASLVKTKVTTLASNANHSYTGGRRGSVNIGSHAASPGTTSLDVGYNPRPVLLKAGGKKYKIYLF